MPTPRLERLLSHGFTLIELLVVIAIIALLSSLVLGVGRFVFQHGRIARAQAELAALGAALENYRREQGDYPRQASEAELLQALLGRLTPRREAMQGRPFIELARFSVERGRDPRLDPAARLMDPWGKPYRYAYQTRSPWRNPGYVLYSLGPDGADAAALLPGGYMDENDPAAADNILARH